VKQFHDLCARPALLSFASQSYVPVNKRLRKFPLAERQFKDNFDAAWFRTAQNMPGVRETNWMTQLVVVECMPIDCSARRLRKGRNMVRDGNL